jgi:hypothetical protein
MRPEEAVINLSRIGFKFEVAGDRVRYRYEGPDDPDPHQVKPLLEVAKAHKEEVLWFLACHCPRCGGVCFVPDYDGKRLCLGCDWDYLVTIYPGLRVKN